MSYSRRLIGFVPLARAASIAALMGATFLSSPLSAQPQPMPAQSPRDAAQFPQAAKESVEQRIGGLHASLQIAPNQEAAWSRVAQTMRDNDVHMRSLVAERAAMNPAGFTAVDDMKWYEKFAKAHVGNLRKLMVSFETLYGAMPDSQKRVADHVFKTFGREPDRRASN